MELIEELFERFYEFCDIRSVFEGVPHLIKTNNLRTFSSFKTNQLEEFEEHRVETSEGKLLFILKVEKEWFLFFRHFLVFSFERFKQNEKWEGQHRLKDIYTKDMESFLRPQSISSETDLISFLKESINHLLCIFPSEECSLFSFSAEKGLKEILNLKLTSSKKEDALENENFILLSQNKIETSVFLSELPLFIKSHSGFKGFDNEENLKKDWKNYACFPLLSGDHIMGVISFKNLAKKGLNLQDFEKLEYASRAIGNILEQGYFQIYLEESSKDNQFLSNYISKFLFNEIEEEGHQNRFKALRKEVVSLFADIRSFTSISESLDPKVLVKLLNIYFEEVTSVIEEHYGTVDKLVGDMIMVKWNIPHDVPDAMVHAVKAALAMQRKMITKVVPHWKEAGVPMVGIGIGVDCGPAYVGNVGSSSFINYTAYGDSVQIAAQLEALARPGQVLITDQYFKKVSGKIPKPYKQLRGVSLKGMGPKNVIQVLKGLDYPDYTSKK